MIKNLIALVLVLLASHAFGANYKIDPDHSGVDFQIRHLVSKVHGEFREFEGSFSYDEKDLSKFSLDATIQAGSIDTRNKKRDEHLKSPDFFNVEKFPTLKYSAKKLEKAGKNKFKVLGELTLLGVSKPVVLDVEFTGDTLDPWGNHKGGLNAKGKVNRKDFGMVWNKTLDKGGVMLGEDVEIQLNLEVVEEKAKASAKN